MVTDLTVTSTITAHLAVHQGHLNSIIHFATPLLSRCHMHTNNCMVSLVSEIMYCIPPAARADEDEVDQGIIRVVIKGIKHIRTLHNVLLLPPQCHAIGLTKRERRDR